MSNYPPLPPDCPFFTTDKNGEAMFCFHSSHPFYLHPIPLWAALKNYRQLVSAIARIGWIDVGRKYGWDDLAKACEADNNERLWRDFGESGPRQAAESVKTRPASPRRKPRQRPQLPSSRCFPTKLAGGAIPIPLETDMLLKHAPVAKNVKRRDEEYGY